MYHTSEVGCSVIEAVERMEIDRASYENYMRMEREKAYLEIIFCWKDEKKRIRNCGKMLKETIKKT